MPNAAPPDWPDLPDEQLLNLRLSELPLRLDGTVVESRIAQLNAELAAWPRSSAGARLTNPCRQRRSFAPGIAGGLPCQQVAQESLD